ncbi:molybdate transport system substrate-binding protein [Abditibacterium utsteinense]|uniref:Molybdate transport system substrate-binding protein n=1 Tax=Abditibacterium utsteinense TaxID=1960156 RepID=A0A2S8SQR7_9BACT|nr:molybdate ABC transporter substrate-binding protein [Abditibacterium utsteinense]PQV63152.1 molybdate transport system substrate-binding protein [Abditibacterium utsteinense]
MNKKNNLGKNLIFRLIFVALFAVLTSRGARADEITVSAAASLKDVLTSLGQDFSRRNPTKIAFNFGSSGTLQRQIEAGAPVDLFIAAAAKNVDALASQHEIESATRRILTRGELVLIAPRGSKLRSFSDLRGADVQSVSIGGPGVPAGDYARQTLHFLRLDTVLSAKFVFAKDVRSVLNQVASGNADAGLVYRTDALSTQSVRIVASAPAKSHAPVIYPMAVVKAASNRAGALRFWRYLQSASAQRTFQRFGFKNRIQK